MKMRRFIAILLTVCTLTVCAGILSMTTVSAASNMTILKGTPTVDGIKDDIYSQSVSVPVTINDTFWSSGDLVGTDTATMWLLYDDKYIYAYVEVKDGDGLTPPDPAYTKDDPNPWQNENAEIWIDESAAGDYASKFSMVYDGSRYYYTMDANSAIDPNKVIAKAGKLDGVKDGFTVEMAIELPAANAPKEGGKIGIAYQVNDHHADGTTSGQGTQKPGDFIYTYGKAVVAPATTAAPTTTAAPAPVATDAPAAAPAPAPAPAPAAPAPAPATGDSFILVSAVFMLCAAGLFVVSQKIKTGKR